MEIARRLYELSHARATGNLRAPVGTVELYRGFVHGVDLPETRRPPIRGEDRLRRFCESGPAGGLAFEDGAPSRKRGGCTPFHPAVEIRSVLAAGGLEASSWRARAGAGTLEIAMPPHVSALGPDERALVAFLGQPRSIEAIDGARLCAAGRVDRLLTFLYAAGALRFVEGHASAWILLQLDEGAPTGEIRRAYRRIARELHPDRHPTAAPEDVRDLERRFAEVTAAYKRLLAK